MADVETAAAAAAVRTVSSASADGTAAVSESLEGLVSAVDELKKSMGLGEQVDLSAIETFIQRLKTENEEFRQFAEEAILVRLRRWKLLWVAGCLPAAYTLARSPGAASHRLELLALWPALRWHSFTSCRRTRPLDALPACSRRSG